MEQNEGGINMNDESKRALYWQSYLSIEKELFEVANYVYITDTPFTKKSSGISPLRTYSNKISDLLVRCCIEIESIIKFLYEYLYDFLTSEEQVKYPSISSKKDYFDGKYFELVNRFFFLDTKVVHINNPIFDLSDSERDITPFDHANFETKSGWKGAYQSVKHNRYNTLEQGNVKNLLHACAALYLLNIYSRDLEIDVYPHEPLQEWYTLGSEIFSVQKPTKPNDYMDLVIKNDRPICNEKTPLVLHYSKKNYEVVKSLFNQYQERYNKWLSSQPEINEPGFLSTSLGLFDGKSDSMNDVFNYRIKKYKEISDFNEKKNIFVHSDDWNYLKYNDLLDINEDMLNPTNIDDEIERLEQKYQDAKRNALFIQPFLDSIDKIPLTICVYGILPASSYDQVNFEDIANYGGIETNIGKKND